MRYLRILPPYSLAQPGSETAVLSLTLELYAHASLLKLAKVKQSASWSLGYSLQSMNTPVTIQRTKSRLDPSFSFEYG